MKRQNTHVRSPCRQAWLVNCNPFAGRIQHGVEPRRVRLHRVELLYHRASAQSTCQLCGPIAGTGPCEPRQAGVGMRRPGATGWGWDERRRAQVARSLVRARIQRLAEPAGPARAQDWVEPGRLIPWRGLAQPRRPCLSFLPVRRGQTDRSESSGACGVRPAVCFLRVR
jgi:hypothetical protein